MTPFLHDFFALEFPEEFRKQIPAYQDDLGFIEMTEDLLSKEESREAALLLLARLDCLPMLNFEFRLHRILSIFTNSVSDVSTLPSISQFGSQY
jgi:hypothetical protein